MSEYKLAFVMVMLSEYLNSELLNGTNEIHIIKQIKQYIGNTMGIPEGNFNKFVPFLLLEHHDIITPIT